MELQTSPSSKRPLTEENPIQGLRFHDDGHHVAAEERTVLRKFDFHFLPILFVMYSFAVLDRSNIAYAKIAGMERDLHMTEGQYNWLGTGFYISFLVFHFTTPAWKILPAHIWISLSVGLWGLTLQAASTSWTGILACRIIMAAAEAGFTPGIPLYFSYFYPREKIGFRLGIYNSATSLASVYGGALAFALAETTPSRLASWRLLFVCEGVPTCLLGIVGWFYCPDAPSTARFLTARERAVAARIAQRQPGDYQHRGLQLDQLGSAFKDIKTYIFSAIFFVGTIVLSAVPLFLPTIVSELGGSFKKQPRSLALNAPPFVLCFFVTIAAAYLSDRTRLRGPYVIALCAIGAIGFLVLATTDAPGVRYFGIFLSTGLFSAMPILVAWLANSFATDSSRTGGTWIFGWIGQCGTLVGTFGNLFPGKEAPLYRRGMWVGFACCVAAAVMAAVILVMFALENKTKERLEPRQGRSSEVMIDVALMGESDTRFREIL